MLKKLGVAISSALFWLLSLSIAGASLTVAGVYVLAGQGWALVCGGAFLLLAAITVFKGLIRG